MTEIPEHLRKRAEEAKAKAAAKAAGDAPAEAAAEAPAAAEPSATDSRIPAHLLERSKSAKAKKEGGAEAAAPAATGGGVATAVADAAPPPTATGPGGHTQRLLTVVKAGSIQDVKSTPIDKVHTWPHLLAVEFVAALAITVFTLIFSIFVNAPLLELANINQTPNPSKAPWYFRNFSPCSTQWLRV